MKNAEYYIKNLEMIPHVEGGYFKESFLSEDNVREQMLFHVMMADSYDEHLYELVDRNIALTDVINDYKNYLKKRRN